MLRPPLSVTIITLNEEKNIARAIQSVKGLAQEVLVVDSGSQDRTKEIARDLGARVLENPWPGYGQQKNFAQNQTTYDWVLNIDADEELSRELALEIQNVLEKESDKSVKGYLLPRLSFYLGQWIRHGGWYPNRQLRLANKKHAKWTEPDVHEELIVLGAVRPLNSDLLHYPFTDIQDQITTNLKFSRLGAERLKKDGKAPSLFKLLVKPIGKFLETFFLKCGFLDGVAGLIISVNAAHSVFLKYAYSFEEKRKLG